MMHDFQSVLQRLPRERRVISQTQPVKYATRRGRHRAENQDQALGMISQDAAGRLVTCAVVADGIGGLDRGAEAANLACSKVVAQAFGDAVLAPPDRLAAALLAANRAVYETWDGRAGAAVVACLVVDGEAFVG